MDDWLRGGKHTLLGCNQRSASGARVPGITRPGPVFSGLGRGQSFLCGTGDPGQDAEPAAGLKIEKKRDPGQAIKDFPSEIRTRTIFCENTFVNKIRDKTLGPNYRSEKIKDFFFAKNNPYQ